MTRLVSLVSLSLLVACHHASAPAPMPATSPASMPTGVATTAQDQIAQGKTLYVAECAKCHGNSGEGTKDGPVVVGKDAFPLHPRAGAKRDVDFHTAADVFAWATKHMPADAPASLTTDQYLAIFAFDLMANGVALDAPLDGAKAQAVVLHP
jgi:cytochrome c5